MMIIDPYRFGGGGDAPQAPFFTFKTKFNGSVSFSIVQSGGELATWFMGDGTVYEDTNSVTHVYADTSEKTVSVSVEAFTDVTGLGSFADKDITEIQFSELSSLGGSILFNANAELATAILPNSSTGTIGFMYFQDCTALTALDISGFSLFNSSRLYFHNLPNLTSLTLPAADSCTGSNFFHFYCYNTAIAGNLDLRFLNGITLNNRNRFFINDNPNLTGLNIPTKTEGNGFDRFLAYNNDLTGTLDLSAMQRTGGLFRLWDFHGNANLTEIKLPDNSATIAINIYAYNCNLTGVLDGSMFKAGNILMNNNPNLTEIREFAAGSVGSFDASDCDLTGMLSQSNYKIRNLGTFIANNNQNLTGVLFGEAAIGPVRVIGFENCNLSVLDLSPIGPQCNAASFACSGNSNLETLTFANGPRLLTGGAGAPFRLTDFQGCNISTTNFNVLAATNWPTVACRVLFDGNALSAAEVNKILVSLDATATLGDPNTDIDISGGTNAAPDATSGGIDGVAAKASLIGKNFNVTTN